jgi:hypothetical protein
VLEEILEDTAHVAIVVDDEHRSGGAAFNLHDSPASAECNASTTIVWCSVQAKNAAADNDYGVVLNPRDDRKRVAEATR